MDAKKGYKDVTAKVDGVIAATDSTMEFWERRVLGVTIRDWGIIAGCLAVLYVFLGFFYAALLNIAIEVRKEDWLLLADNHYGPFERVDRFLMDPATGNKIPALAEPEDITIATKETIFRKYNRPDGCITQTMADQEVLVCDASGKASDNRWIVHPWLLDLAVSNVEGYNNAACAMTNSGASILQTSGLYYGDGTCVNGATPVMATAVEPSTT